MVDAPVSGAQWLVGHEFTRGDNPRVNAQFSVQYCVANALVHGASALAHFRPRGGGSPQVMALIGRVSAVGDEALDARGHSAVDVKLTTREASPH